MSEQSAAQSINDLMNAESIAHTHVHRYIQYLIPILEYRQATIKSMLHRNINQKEFNELLTNINSKICEILNMPTK